MENLFLTPFVRSLATAVVAGVVLAGGMYAVGLVLVVIAILAFAFDLRRLRSRRWPL